MCIPVGKWLITTHIYIPHIQLGMFHIYIYEYTCGYNGITHLLSGMHAQAVGNWIKTDVKCGKPKAINHPGDHPWSFFFQKNLLQAGFFRYTQFHKLQSNWDSLFLGLRFTSLTGFVMVISYSPLTKRDSAHPSRPSTRQEKKKTVVGKWHTLW